MQINDARIENGNLVLSMPTASARIFVYKFKAGEYEIKPVKKKRSLDANAYVWVLCNKIGEAVRESPTTIYKQSLEHIPNICQAICIPSAAVSDMERVWTKGYIGRRVEVMESKIKDCSTMFLYFGSSDFDNRQMSMLIDNLIQDAKSLGIETRPNEEVKALLEGWQ